MIIPEKSASYPRSNPFEIHIIIQLRLEKTATMAVASSTQKQKGPTRARLVGTYIKVEITILLFNQVHQKEDGCPKKLWQDFYKN